VGTTVNGVWQGSTDVGTASAFTWHTYQIQLATDGTFSVFLDGTVLRSGISAGPASAWAGGIGTGTLFTLSSLDERHLSTAFDNVRALGATPSAPNLPPWLPGNPAAQDEGASVNLSWNAAGATSPNNYQAAYNRETLITTGITSTAFADFVLSNGTTDIDHVSAAIATEESGPSGEILALPQAGVWGLDALVNLSAPTSDAQAWVTSGKGRGR
jgi:hypothetical protein